MNQTLLVELLTEELPPKALARLGAAFAAGVEHGLRTRAFLEPDAQLTVYATPRRLALTLSGVRAVSPDKTVREKVLPVAIAFDQDGKPTAPLQKKLAALARQSGSEPAVDALERAADGKSDSLFYSYTAPGVALAAGLQASLEEAVARLPIPKLMSYQRPDGQGVLQSVQFVRPVHGLLALHGTAVVPVSLLGLDASQNTSGHRFLGPKTLPIPSADQYASLLEQKGKVIASFEARRERIVAQLRALAGDDQILMPDALLDEVTALVEWPAAYACEFDSDFLAVPQECLILTMQTNQKYFALTGSDGRLRARFLIISNIATDDPGHIIQGNERVVRPRLSDARFFFEQDKKRSLAERIPDLSSVVYHNKLGTQGQRTERVTALAGAIAGMLGQDIPNAARAAWLAKADLLTDMVGEFPELQGVMGTYYARHDGEPEEVALAISEHYQPRFAGDALPGTDAGTAVAMADKLETIVGIWGIGLHPTGDKDPFALRRHALGVLRMLIEKSLPLAIPQLLREATQLFSRQSGFEPALPAITAFLMDRLRGLLRERGYAANEIEAVVAQQPERLDNLIARLEAVRAFAALPQAESLAAANKRITNILKKSDDAQHALASTLQPALFTEAAEQRLADAMERSRPQVQAAFDAGDYSTALTALAQLRDDVDGFFNDVMVMAEDPALRANRLALLAALHAMMNQVADISKLAS